MSYFNSEYSDASKTHLFSRRVYFFPVSGQFSLNFQANILRLPHYPDSVVDHVVLIINSE